MIFLPSDDDDDDDNVFLSSDDDDDEVLNEANLLRIQRNDPSFTSLRVKGHNWIIGAGNAISQSKRLRRLEMLLESNERDDGWQDLCHGLARNRSIATFDMTVQRDFPCRDFFRIVSPFFELNGRLRNIKLHDSCFPPTNGIDDDCISILSNALMKNAKIERLEFVGCLKFSATGWRTLSSALAHPKCSVQDLSICYTSSISDGVLFCLALALESSKSLRCLNIDNVTYSSTTSAGWDFFATCLKHPNCALDTLYIEECNIDANGAAAIVSALSGNKRLTELHIIKNNQLKGKDWSDLSIVLCDKTSIENTFSSNHTLLEVDSINWWTYYDSGDESDSDSDSGRDEDVGNWKEVVSSDSYIATMKEIEVSLGMNQKKNKAEVARHKILKHHFLRGEIHVGVFASMAETALPNAIEWIGRSNDPTLHNLELTVMYNFVQSFPELFDIRDSSQSAPAKRRKH